jgi:hypothetical protein
MKQLIILAAATLLGGPAVAQGQNDTAQPLVIFSKGHFEGARQPIYGPWQHITPEFTARSVQVPEGQSWELCSGNTFTGCKEFSQSVTATVVSVRSARPVASAIVSGPGSGAGAVASLPAPDVPDRSLKGLASEYFVAPHRGGARITVQPGTAEAMRQAANDFCRSKGWRMSAYARLQKAGGAFYLADVLCADSGG